MKLTNNLSKVEIKKSKEAVTGKMGLSWLMHVMKDFGVSKMISAEYKNGSNREIEYLKKIMAAVMTRVDGGLLESLGWEEMMSADTYLNLIKDKRSNGKLRQINNKIVIKALKGLEEEELTYDNDATYFDSEAAGKRIKYFRSDSAAYRMDIMMDCAIEGIIYFISADKDAACEERLKGSRQANGGCWRVSRQRMRIQNGPRHDM